MNFCKIFERWLEDGGRISSGWLFVEYLFGLVPNGLHDSLIKIVRWHPHIGQFRMCSMHMQQSRLCTPYLKLSYANFQRIINNKVWLLQLSVDVGPIYKQSDGQTTITNGASGSFFTPTS